MDRYTVYKRTLHPLTWHKTKSFNKELHAMYEQTKWEKLGYTTKIIKEKI